MSYQAIDRYERDCPVARRCDLLGVSAGGYYAWRDRPASLKAQADRVLGIRIRMVFAAEQATYGSRRIREEVRAPGMVVGRRRVRRLMREQGLVTKQAWKFKATTDSHHRHPVAPNRLAGDVAITQENQAWAADLTYIRMAEGWLYLAAVLDLYSRRIVGWATGSRMTRQLTLEALQRALQQRLPGAGLIHHSDRGSQYASQDYQTALQRHGFLASMSGRGNCYDNATMESFFHTLKVERVHGQQYPARSVAERDLFEYIEIDYNRRRRHSALGYLSPLQFEEEMAKAA